ncbi:MAG: NaeI family type II restriction endonuclease [Acidimicrobiaceae bacterium]|nr:NaeI family type II restriction endonuclease [Acidimicrobiaceae bacterium]
MHLDEETRSAILDDAPAGQQRVNQLFRCVHNKIVRREVVLTVAQQDDGPKRVRDARKALQPEGIVVLGHQGSHPGIAEGLKIEVPRKGSWIASRVVKTDPDAIDSVLIAGERWRRAMPNDPVHAGPVNYQ